MLLSLELSDILIEEKIRGDGFTNILTKIASVYSIHLAIIIAGFFTRVNSKNEQKLDNEKISSVIIILLSVCWNLLVIITLINYANSKLIDYSQFIQRLDSISGAMNFLVAGGLAYYFGKAE